MSPEDCGHLFPDDADIGDEVALLRRIPPWHFYLDPATERMRPSSAAFEDVRDGDPMSVYRRDVLESEGRDAGCVMIGHQGYALAALPAGEFRLKAQAVHPDPLPESRHTSRYVARSRTVCGAALRVAPFGS